MNDYSDRWLHIDDVRTLGADLTVRTSAEGKSQLLAHKWGHLILDNDLGLNQEEGWEILRWALEHDCCPPHVQLVTANPVARSNMENMLRDRGYTSESPFNFFLSKEN